MSMNIIIRTDASSMIGTGHVMRCLTLAEKLTHNCRAKITFICRDLPGNLSEVIKSKGYACKLLAFSPENKGQYSKTPPNDDYNKWLGVRLEDDAKETLENALEFDEKIDLFIIDHYALDIRWEKLLRPKVEKIMVIDDLANRKHDCDIILDHNFYLNLHDRYNNLVPSGCLKFLGPSALLLRKEFFKYKKTKIFNVRKNILVFMGGD